MADFSSLNGYTVKDAIARNIAKGRNQALAYADYATMVETLNAMDNEQFKVGQNIYIGTVGVPDLWVHSIEHILHDYSHVSDEATVELLKNNGTIQVGYYKLAMLEGQKVDLTPVNTKLSEHDTKLSEHENAISEQNKNISEQQIVLDNYSDRLASIESIMGSYVESTSGSFVINGLQANGGTTERIITFSNPLFKVPTVTTSTTDTAASLTVSNVSQSGFKIKIVNTYKYDAISPVISWIAVAK